MQMMWKCREREVDVTSHTQIMGILNATPDSFSDGGRYADTDAAVSAAGKMLSYGADIIDVGGESTRPGAPAVEADEEIRRVVPVIRGIREQFPECLISVDTMKAAVARQALEAGADIVNDVSALSFDAAMAGVVHNSGAGVVLMHMQGLPQTMQDHPLYNEVVDEVVNYLSERIRFCEGQGISREQLAVDPGIGFGKTLEHNVQLLAGLQCLAELGRPVLVGLSRKSMLGALTGRNVDDRLGASLAGMVCAMERGAHILRVHDVKESCDARAVADTICRESQHSRA